MVDEVLPKFWVIEAIGTDCLAAAFGIGLLFKGLIAILDGLATVVAGVTKANCG